MANHSSITTLDLSPLPEVYVLPLHLSTDEVHELEERLSGAGATVTYDILDARLVIGAVGTTRRAKFELQSRGIRVEDVPDEHGRKPSPFLTEQRKHVGRRVEVAVPRSKRRKVSSVMPKFSDSSLPETSVPGLESETEDDDGAAAKSMSQLSVSQTSADAAALSSDLLGPEGMELIPTPEFPEDMVKVVKLSWFQESQRTGRLLPLEAYTVYRGRLSQRTEIERTTAQTQAASALHRFPQDSRDAARGTVSSNSEVENMAHETSEKSGKSAHTDRALQQGSGRRMFGPSWKRAKDKKSPAPRPVHLLRETTSEHDEGISSTLPEMPQWVKEHKLYACERSTPLYTPNDNFIAELKKIKLARVLTGDEIGVRAYSTSIASLAAYPHKLSSTKEVLALPGCDHKIAHLFYEWETTGRIQAVDEIDRDPALTILRDFYNIWGVGAKTAREFYYDRKRKDRDDLIEFEWHSLSRVQQIGLKYYDEFELKISRSEVEYIASVVTYHAKKVADDGIECVVVGGYRRGRTENGDVDIIVSHPDESVTDHLISSIVNALVSSGWITHTLSISTANSDRGQQPVSYRFGDEKRGTGFDTLDKALVVWQDPTWSAEDPGAKNPNVHRRVDIIVSPWRTVGCAVAGWTSGTTFQRDLRRYAKYRKGWKFDSSGVRERGTGKWVDLERWTDVKARAKTWQEAERRVFEGLGLEWREPEERNTG